MLHKQIIILLSLALFAVLTLAEAWDKDAALAELQATWEGKTVSYDYYGRPIDPATACDGKPCNYPELVQYDEADISGPFCMPAGSDQVICDHLPENATLVPESGPRRSNGSVKEPVKPAAPVLASPSILARNGSMPTQTSYLPSASKGYLLHPIQTPHLSSVSKRYIPKSIENPDLISGSEGSMHKPAKTVGNLQKRSRWALDDAKMLSVWPSNKKITYGVWAENKYLPQVWEYMKLVRLSFNTWKSSCEPHGASFFDNWSLQSSDGAGNKPPTANFWFYFVDGPVCGMDGAIACAFFPNMYTRRKTVFVNLKLFLAKEEKGRILTLVHEIGHLIGLAHEDKGDGPLWITSDKDPKSIMRWRYRASNSITTTDCRAMKFYASGFKAPLMCGAPGGKEIKCKPMTKDVVDLKQVELPRDPPKYKQLPRDELLVDIHNPECLGPDISKYFIINADDHGGRGSLRRGMLISQCLAVRVPSDPNFIYAMQSDGNFVSYNIKTGQAVWSTGSQGLGTGGDYDMAFQEDGNLVLYDTTGKSIWSSGTHYGSPDSFRIMTEVWQFRDGHMYTTDLHGRSSWATATTIAHGNVVIQQRGQNGGASGWCVDAISIEGPTFLSICDTNRKLQHWDVRTDGTIRNVESDLCMYDRYGENGERVSAFPCDANDKRYQWQVHSDGTIRNRYSNKCLDNRAQQLKDGNQIQVYDCIDAWSEKWRVGIFA